MLKKCLIVISAKHSIIATIEGNAINVIYKGELEIHTELTHRCATCSAWPCPLPILMYLALAAKTLDNSALERDDTKLKWNLEN